MTARSKPGIRTQREARFEPKRVSGAEWAPKSRAGTDVRVIVTCEHASAAVPRPFADAFESARDVLPTHRGFDAGALELARRFAKHRGVPLFASTVTRLLVDANRSEDNEAVFSSWSRALPASTRSALLRKYHRPHRTEVEAAVRAVVATRKLAVHVAVHSFTPVFDGRRRSTDVGILFDPSRPTEAQLAKRWQTELARRRPDLVVHRNRPYRGWTDGLATALRKRFGPLRYAGFELEINQRWVTRKAGWPKLQDDVIASFDAALLATLRAGPG